MKERDARGFRICIENEQYIDLWGIRNCALWWPWPPRIQGTLNKKTIVVEVNMHLRAGRSVWVGFAPGRCAARVIID